MGSEEKDSLGGERERLRKRMNGNEVTAAWPGSSPSELGLCGQLCIDHSWLGSLQEGKFQLYQGWWDREQGL